MILIPILGWLVLFGYIIRLVNEFIEERYEEPIDIDLIEDLKFGAITFLKALPFIIVYAIITFAISYISSILGDLIDLLLRLFVIPILSVNFFRKQTIESFFEFDIFNVAKENLEDFIMVSLKQFALNIVFAILSIILIGIPGLLFTSSIFIANFYGRVIVQKNSIDFQTQINDPSSV